MKAHHSTILSRMRKVALSRVPKHLRYRVVAIGLDHRNSIISIKSNLPRLINRGWHAEELLLHSTPRCLSRIIIARFGRTGDLLPIDPCEQCQRLAVKFGVRIERIQV